MTVIGIDLSRLRAMSWMAEMAGRVGLKICMTVIGDECQSV
jgi:hypothetical protein